MTTKPSETPVQVSDLQQKKNIDKKEKFEVKNQFTKHRQSEH